MNGHCPQNLQFWFKNGQKLPGELSSPPCFRIQEGSSNMMDGQGEDGGGHKFFCIILAFV